MIQRLRNRQRGFTLIELLIVVAIIGIIAAILIPNLIDALQKAKQKRTVGDMRTAGTAMMAYVTDQASAAAAGRSTDQWTWPTGSDAVTDYAGIEPILHQNSTFFYLQDVPQNDGWAKPFEWFLATGTALLNSTNVAAIRSGGRHGSMEGPDYTPGAFITTDYDQDIVWADGFFVRVPGGFASVGAVAN